MGFWLSGLTRVYLKGLGKARNSKNVVFYSVFWAAYRPQANWGGQLLYIYWVHTFQMATAKAIHILGP